MPYPPIQELPNDPDGCKKAVRDAFIAGSERMCRIEDALESLKKSQQEQKAAMNENTAATLDTQSQMSEAVGILNAMKGGMKVLNWLGQGLKWAAMVAGAMYTFWCIAKGKNPFQ